MHTKFASISSSNEIVVVSTFQIELGAAGGKLNICLPYSMIEPLRDLLTRPLQEGGANDVDQRWTQQLSREVRAAQVQLIAEFAHIDMNVGELMRLQINDILPLEIPEKVTAHVGGVPVLEAGYGTYNGKMALRVNKMLNVAQPNPTVRNERND